MKKTYKIITALASALSLCAGTFLLSSCGDSVSAVVVGRNDTPRLTYVQGQDLDFSTGKLTVQYESGKSESVELNSPDVVVSGYDKNALGRQTVTLTYKENETTLDVMVIARLSAESVQTVYYVGEQNFDTAKGKIRIANDDGTTFTLSLSDKSLSFSEKWDYALEWSGENKLVYAAPQNFLPLARKTHAQRRADYLYQRRSQIR